jgi:hypothetical protein
VPGDLPFPSLSKNPEILLGSDGRFRQKFLTSDSDSESLSVIVVEKLFGVTASAAELHSSAAHVARSAGRLCQCESVARHGTERI